MGKSYKRNSFRKPKQHGKIFEKKNKWNPKKYIPFNDPVEVELESIPEITEDPS